MATTRKKNHRATNCPRQGVGKDDGLGDEHAEDKNQQVPRRKKGAVRSVALG